MSLTIGKTYLGARRTLTVDDWRALGWPTTQAHELATTFAPTVQRATVLALSDDGIGELLHYPYHSPTGFEWGYGGSGPADLARAILLDHYSLAPDARGSLYPPTLNELPVEYQRFKAEVIARLPREEPWSLTTRQIEQWTRKQAVA